MAKVKLTAGRIVSFKCDEGKAQSFLWCDEVPGLGVRATPSSTEKSYIYQAKVKGKTMRITIGKVNKWSIKKAQEEARELQVQIDKGNDPREVKADNKAAKETAKLAKEAEATALTLKQASEAVTAGEAWQAYIADRSASMVDGKPEWGEKHRAQHDYFVQAGGVKRTRGRRPNESETTRPAFLFRLWRCALLTLTQRPLQYGSKKKPPKLLPPPL
jgi:hypothetical protein